MTEAGIAKQHQSLQIAKTRTEYGLVRLDVVAEHLARIAARSPYITASDTYTFTRVAMRYSPAPTLGYCAYPTLEWPCVTATRKAVAPGSNDTGGSRIDTPQQKNCDVIQRMSSEPALPQSQQTRLATLNSEDTYGLQKWSFSKLLKIHWEIL